MGRSSRADGGVRILLVDINNVLMLFPCCEIRALFSGSFENGINSQLIAGCL